MYRLKIFLTFSITILFFLFCGAASAGNTSQPGKISVVYCQDCPPFQFQNEEKTPDGMLIDHWKLWSKKTGIKVDYLPATWAETLSMVKDGKADAHAGLFYSKPRDEYLLYGPAMRQTDTHIFYHKSVLITEEQDILPFRVGVISGDLVESYLKNKYPELTVIGYPDYESLMTNLQDGKLQIFAADTLTGLHYLQKKKLIQAFHYKANLPLYRSDWFLAVPEDNVTTLEVIKKGMALITDKEKNDISRHWVTSSGGMDPNTLVIALDRDYPPFSLLGLDGKPTGLLVDMWKRWSKAVDLPVSFMPVSWAESIEAVRTGEADIHSGLSKNKDQEWMAFSQPLQKLDTAIYSLANREEPVTPTSITPYDITIANLSGKQVAVLAGSFQETHLKLKHPDIKLVPYPDRESMVLAVFQKHADALIHDTPMVEATLEHLQLKNVLIRSATLLFTTTVHAGVSKQRQELIDVINTGFASIPLEFLSEIESRWLPSRVASAKVDSTTPTHQERAWVAEHPIITVANEMDWAPFDYNESGVPKGLSIDHIKLLAKKAGLEIKFINGLSWSELLEQFKAKKIDIIPAMYQSKEREAFTLFTKPYYKGKLGIFIHEDGEGIRSPSDLLGKKTGILKDDGSIPVVKAQIPGLELIEYANNNDLVKMLGTQKLDAIIGSPLLYSHLAKANQISKIRLDSFIEMDADDQKKISLHVGVRNDYPLLHQILSKAMLRVSREEMNRIEDNWYHVQLEKTHLLTRKEQLLKADIELTKEEYKWLETHKTITYSEVNWKPLSIIENDSMTGIMGDYLDLVSKRTGIKFKFVPSKTWPDVLDKFKKGEIDLVPGIGNSKEELALGSVSDRYAEYPMAIITNESIAYVRNLQGLKNKVFSVPKTYTSYNYLKSILPDVKIIETDSVEQALQNVEAGKADAFLGHLAPAVYYLSQTNSKNLKIAGYADFKFRHHYLITDKHPELLSIVNKIFAKITERERLKIFDEWIHTEVTSGFDYSLLKWLFLILGVFVLIIIVIIAWNRRLGREISGRKAVEIKFRAMSDASYDAMVMITSEGIVNFWNKAAEEMFGYTHEQAMDKNMHSLFVSKEHHKAASEGLKLFAQSGDGAVIGKVIEEKAIRHNGDVFPVEIAVSSFQLDDMWYAVGFIRDITNRQQIENQIKSARKELLLIFDNSQVGILFTHKNKQVARLNQSMADILKYQSPGDLVGKNIELLFTDTSQFNSFAVANDKILLQGKKCQGEYEISRKDGTTVWCSVSGKAVDTSQPPDLSKGIIWVVENITARKKAEEELKTKEKRLRAYFENSLVGVTITHPERGWIEVNDCFLEMIGYTRDELESIKWEDLSYSEDLESELEPYRGMLKGEIESFSIDKRFIRKDGSVIHTNIAVSCVRDNQDNVAMVMGSYVDITETKKTELEMKSYVADLEKFNHITISREERMIDLKDEVNNLLVQQGEPQKYKIR